MKKIFFTVDFTSFVFNTYIRKGVWREFILFVFKESLRKLILSYYNITGIYLFKIGSHIKLRDIQIFGYGLRPCAKVIGHLKLENSDKGNSEISRLYVLEVTTDDEGDILRLISEGWVPEGVTRSTYVQRFLKTDIEGNFCQEN